MASTQWQDDRLYLIGHVDFENAAQIYASGLDILDRQSSHPLLIDLSQLEHGNTLVLAVCVQWFRKYSMRTKLQLINVPEKMRGIIKASHLEQMLN